MALTESEEDRIAEILSNLTPMEYSALMTKVRRGQWILTGPISWAGTRGNPEEEKPRKYKRR